VTDFGLAKQLDDGQDHTREGYPMGTPAYMPPEQAAGDVHAIGPHSDQWSLGIILYEMLTGRVPYAGESLHDTLTLIRTTDPVPPRRLRPKLPGDLETICLKCLQHDPARRYASAGELADDLRRWLDGEPIRARPVSVVEKTIKWARRRPGAAAAVVLALLCVLSVVTGVVMHFRSVAQEAQRDLAEAHRLEDQRIKARLWIEEAEKLITTAEAVPLAKREANDTVWTDARSRLASAVNLIGEEPSLSGLKERAAQLQDRAQKGIDQQANQRTTGAKVSAFNQYTDYMRFYNTRYTGFDVPENTRKAREAASKAVALFGWSANADPEALQKNPYLTDATRLQLRADGSGLLLILAQETLADAGTPEAARTALALLDQAARLQTPGPAHCQARAECHARLGDAAAAKADTQKADDLIQEMQQLGRRGNGSDHFLLALGHYKKGDLNKAIVHFNGVIREQPGDFWSLFYLGICYLRSVRPGEGRSEALASEARASLTACIVSRPRFVWIYLLRGLANGELAVNRHDHGAPEEAERSLAAAENDFARAQELAQTDNERYVLLVNRGVTRFRFGPRKWDDSAADYKAAIALKPDSFQAYNNLANLHRARKEYPQALDQLKKAIDLKPSALPALHRTRAQVHELRNDLNAALADLGIALELEKVDRTFRATVYLERGQVELQQVQSNRKEHAAAALKDFDEALKLQPNLIEAQKLRAVALLHLERFTEAVRACDDYLAQHPGPATAEVYEERGLALERLGNYSGAIDDFTRALAVKDDPRVRRERGWAYLINDVPRLALRDFEQAAELAPQNSDVFNGRGFARVKLARTAEMIRDAVKDAEEAVRLNPKDRRTLYNAARTCAQAVARVDELKGPRTPQTADVRLQYQERALGLLREAVLQVAGAPEREAFWRDSAQRDRELAPLRQTATFLRMAREYGKMARDAAVPVKATP
jgi:tetratricopeptide (TPR) repeat protein